MKDKVSLSTDIKVKLAFEHAEENVQKDEIAYFSNIQSSFF
jgi:hypothetical protein